MTGVMKIKEIRQLRYINGLSIREVARRTGISRNTIRRILRSDRTKLKYQRSRTPQPATGGVRGLIEEWIKEDLGKNKKKRRTATRIYEILREQYGYEGSYESIAKAINEIRDKVRLVKAEAFIPLTFDPAEAFQYDWGDVAVYIGGVLTTLHIALVVLCHSRAFFVRAYPCQKQELMLDSHQRAFEYFGGTCKRGIYDNMKTAVKQLLKGHHRNIQERFAMFCSHYLFEPEFCNPARGNEKGRVENKIGYVKRNFFIPVPSFSSIEELNERLLIFAGSKARLMRHPEMPEKTCYQVYEEEKDKLVQLPLHGFECCRTVQAVVSPVSTIFYDNNRYSVPAEYLNRAVQVRGYADEIVASYQGKIIARHKRQYGKNRQVYNPYHYLGVLARKPRAFKNGKPFRNWQLPEIFSNYRRLLNERHEDGDIYFARTLILLKDWPVKEVVQAMKESISRGILGDSYILGLLKHDKDNDAEQQDVLIRTELMKYRSRQKPLNHYDEMLRPKRKEVIENEWSDN